MRTIEQHNQIISTQAKDLTKVIIRQAKQFGFPYTWNHSYWQGYCTALDQSGQLWNEVRESVLNNELFK